MVKYYGGAILPEEWKSETGLKLLYASMPSLLAEDELRQRAIGNEITPEHAFNLVIQATGDFEEARNAKEEIELQRANNEYGERQ